MSLTRVPDPYSLITDIKYVLTLKAEFVTVHKAEFSPLSASAIAILSPGTKLER